MKINKRSIRCVYNDESQSHVLNLYIGFEHIFIVSRSRYILDKLCYLKTIKKIDFDTGVQIGHFILENIDNTTHQKYIEHTFLCDKKDKLNIWITVLDINKRYWIQIQNTSKYSALIFFTELTKEQLLDIANFLIKIKEERSISIMKGLDIMLNNNIKE